MEKVSSEKVVEYLLEKFDKDILTVEKSYDFLTIKVNKEKIINIIKFLYDHKELQFQFLTTLFGVHYPTNKGNELGVVYQLHSLINNLRIRLKIYFPIDKPEVPTLTGIFAAANWMERETYDFFGIIFKGHPNLKRILNVEDMLIFPLRKEYPLEDQTREDKKDDMFGR